MATSSIRALVVDDFEPFRRFICSTLEQIPDLQVIGEAFDGLEAVQKTQELKPDLILLDMGLPTLNGIEAANRIRQVAPDVAIIFLTQNRDKDVVRAALSTGARGYVVKSDAGSELLRAVEAVLHGKKFVSASLSDSDLSDPKDEHAADHPHGKEPIEPLPPEKVASRHEIAFYPDDAAFVEGFARVTEAALKVGNAVILIATGPHRADIVQRLRADAVDVDVALKKGSYIPLDAVETLATLMVNDLPDPVRCAKVVGDLIMRATQGAMGEHSRVVICGECAPTLLALGNVEAAIRLEHLWGKVTKTYRADTLCGYLWSDCPQEERGPIFERICAEHTVVHGRAPG
jgi:DNA-binding NarL/FixJ family response regulator